MWQMIVKTAKERVPAPIKSALLRFASLRITIKFGLSSGLLMIVVLAEMGIGYWALNSLWRADLVIQENAETQRLVMTMGRNWEATHRLQQTFFLNSREEDAEEVYRVYALASANKLNEVIRDGAMLKRRLSAPNAPPEIRQQTPQLDLILSTASQYATALDAATRYELRLMATGSGLHHQRMQLSDELLTILAQSAEPTTLKSIFYEMHFFEETNRRSMETTERLSRLARYDQLRVEIENSSLSAAQKTTAADTLLAYQQIMTAIDQTEGALSEARSTLDQLGEAIDPTLIELMGTVNTEMGRARVEFAQTRQNAIGWLAMVAVTGATIALGVAILLHYSVTRQVTRLTDVANRMREGDLSVRAQPETTDEVGQLALTFNAMAAQLNTTIERMNVVRQAGVELASELDIEKVSTAALRTAVELSNADAGFLAMMEGDTLRVTHSVGAYPRGFVGSRLPLKNCGIEEALAMRRVVPISHEDCPFSPTGRVQILIPLVAGYETIGLLLLESQQPGFPAAELVAFLELYAASASNSIHNARRYGDVQQMAVVDSLTGLYNRRGFFQLGKDALERVIHRRLTASMIFLDIDHFKQFNDLHSYADGDLVLRTIADILRANIGDADLLCRYGGEEFVILLPEKGLYEAAALAERLRHAVEITPLATDRVTLSVTVSIGLSTWRPGKANAPVDVAEEVLKHLIEEAGRMLHTAKSSGRNRVAIAGYQPFIR